MLTAPTVAELSAFKGRDTYGPFADEALAQATLLFAVLTKRDSYPDDAQGAALARNAIMEMADRFYLSQPHAEILASPFQSETIGSYSYAKVVQQARNNEPTGLFWWDLALDELSLKERSSVSSGAVTVFENEHMYISGEGRQAVINPADLAESDGFYFNGNDPPRR